MSNNLLDIKDLVMHIIKNPDYRYSANYFAIGDHHSEYNDTKFRPKEHKLWTQRKTPKYRCFYIIQNINNQTLRMHDVLDDAEIYLNGMGYTNLNFVESQTYAAMRRTIDQFEGAIEISLNNMPKFTETTYEDSVLQKALEIKNIIIDITDETVRRGLHLSQK